jgi:hypothetical protein
MSRIVLNPPPNNAMELNTGDAIERGDSPKKVIDSINAMTSELYALSIQGANASSVTLTNQAYSAQTADLGSILDVSNAGGHASITLLSAAAAGNGAVQYIRKADAVNLAITGAADNGSTLIRLTMADTSKLATNQVYTVEGVTGTIEANGTWAITVIDATHIDLQGSVFANAYVSGGALKNSRVIVLDSNGTTNLAWLSAQDDIVGFLSNGTSWKCILANIVPMAQWWSANGTWTKAPLAKRAKIFGVGQGGGGGSGARRATGGIRTGGAGGAGGFVAYVELAASLLAATEPVTIGNAANGGAAVSANDTNGNAGTGGSGTSFGNSNPIGGGTWLNARGGANGAGGGTSNAAGGAAGASGFTNYGLAGPGVGSSSTGVPSNAGAIGVTGGGGAGGSADAANTQRLPSQGGGGSAGFTAAGSSSIAGGAAGTAGNNGGAGTDNFGTDEPGGAGGGGGYYVAATAGTNGGRGGYPGGGGGGGAASDNGTNSGAGGQGGRGELRVVQYF